MKVSNVLFGIFIIILNLLATLATLNLMFILLGIPAGIYIITREENILDD